jgi:hypothetical protein
MKRLPVYVCIWHITVLRRQNYFHFIKQKRTGMFLSRSHGKHNIHNTTTDYRFS